MFFLPLERINPKETSSPTDAAGLYAEAVNSAPNSLLSGVSHDPVENTRANMWQQGVPCLEQEEKFIFTLYSLQKGIKCQAISFSTASSIIYCST